MSQLLLPTKNVSVLLYNILFTYLLSDKPVVDYADLAVIDLALTGTPEGRAKLAIQTRDVMKEQGFFYVINHGWNQEQVRRKCTSYCN